MSKAIGILGGSFNPAHAGHLHLSHEALERLGLDEVWWLLSPHNPLKEKDDLADYEVRKLFALEMLVDEPRIHLSEFEHEHRLQYTAQTLPEMAAIYSKCRFVWLMGADNLASFHHWQEWQSIMRLLPIAVFDRAPYSEAAKEAVAAQEFAKYEVAEAEGEALKDQSAPAWCYIKMPLHPESSTNLRKTLGDAAFSLHNDGMGEGN